MIDKLTLSYSGNQVQNIADAATDPLYEGAFNFVDGNKTNEVEYTYDANGNLTLDKNKGIAKIQYNKLNLPDKLQFAYGHTTEYLYDAAGVKHNVKQTTVKDNLLVPMGSTVAVPADKVAITNQTDYCGNMIYEDGNLKMILTDEGYIDMSTGSSQYCYYIKDHQGNNRVVENQAGVVLQSNHYYPFGMTFGEGNNNILYADKDDLSWHSFSNYKYNGKELDRMHGLDLYDYGARMYDSAIGRWGSVDPLAEKYYSISPYAYCGNNSVRFIDPDGRKIVDSKGKEITYSKERGWSSNVTNDVMRIFNSLDQTPTGKITWENAVNVKHGISFDIKKDLVDLGNDKVKLGKATGAVFTKNKDGSFSVKGNVSIILYEGSIEKYAKGLSLSVDQVIGSVSGHEITHATDKENINMQGKIALSEKNESSLEEQAEIKPTLVENKILEEIKK